MKIDKLHESGLSERRFGTILSIFKLAGIPLTIHSVSRVQSVYNIVIAVCFYATFTSKIMDMHVDRNNFEELMSDIRLCLSMASLSVFDIFFRFGWN
jgi:hypothetical protein